MMSSTSLVMKKTEIEKIINTDIQTIMVPSEREKEQRKIESPHASAEEISLDVFQTRDLENVGMKFVVAYRITDPTLADKRLGAAGILTHIETFVRVDMAIAIKRNSLQDFMAFWQNKVALHGNAPQLHFMDLVKNTLAKDLILYGIELVRLNIEYAQIVLPATIAAKKAGLVQQTRTITAESRQKTGVIAKKMV